MTTALRPATTTTAPTAATPARQTEAPSAYQHRLGSGVHLLPQTDQLRALHTVVRDRDARREDFVFYAGRIIRLLTEAALNLLPFEPYEVTTPVGRTYRGLRFADNLVGVPIVRAGESMEAELRAVVPGIRIGKVLIQRDRTTKQPRLYYTAFPEDIASRQVLLLDPMLATGGTALAAIEVLRDLGVPEENIVFVTFITCPEGLAAVGDRYPGVRIVTSAIEEGLNEHAFMMPGIGDFGDRYFGTDR
ncbi:uracil phosphoribosyltransferase [Streptomyces sp. NPDC096080]|uniref:uracil phosphoribosyltransferase n=1 Tax=Streptomyces sp. NPDC096080 TaxID=3156693 RepID=UPI00332AB012